MYVNLIVAYCKNRGIGMNNKLPWKYKEDLKYFKTITVGNNKNAIIMGKNTFNSIGRILPNRYNIILSTTSTLITNKNYAICNSMYNAINLCEQLNMENVFIIGGANVYKQALQLDLINYIYATEINKDYECDTFIDLFNNFECIEENKKGDLNFKIFKRK